MNCIFIIFFILSNESYFLVLTNFNFLGILYYSVHIIEWMMDCFILIMTQIYLILFIRISVLTYADNIIALNI